MTREELQIKITELLPAASFEERGDPTTNGWLNINIGPAEWPGFANKLRNTPGLDFDYLFCLTCIDWPAKSNLQMVYHLESTLHRHIIVVKALLNRSKPEIETVSSVWRTAEFHEREVYELFGVNFLHHPDLRLLILPEGWEGKNPLRKDFEDEVNMIKL